MAAPWLFKISLNFIAPILAIMSYNQSLVICASDQYSISEFTTSGVEAKTSATDERFSDNAVPVRDEVSPANNYISLSVTMSMEKTTEILNCNGPECSETYTLTKRTVPTNITLCQSMCVVSSADTANVSMLPNITFANSSYSANPYWPYMEYNVYNIVYDYGSYITSIPGIITNTLCIVVILQLKPFCTSEIYMLFLSVSDFINVFLRIIWFAVIQANFAAPVWLCRCIPTIVNITFTYSSCIIASWTVERFIAVHFPQKLGVWCTINKTKIVLVALFITALALNVPYTFGIVREISTDDDRLCKSTRFIINTSTIAKAVYYIYLPLTVIVVCNTAIIKTMNRRTQSRLLTIHNAVIRYERSQQQAQMTMTLICIACIYIILHVPQSVATIWMQLYPDPLEAYSNDKHKIIKFYLYTLLGLKITEFQNSIHFFIYCLTGSKFRETFVKIMCFRRSKRLGLRNLAVVDHIALSTISAVSSRHYNIALDSL